MLKKILTLFICLIICCGCRPINISENQTITYKITSYKGIPSLCLLPITNNEYDINIVDSNSEIRNEFQNLGSDIIIAPIDVGVDECQKGGSYKLYSIIEYGNLYLASTDESTFEGDVGAYGEDSIVGRLVNYLSQTDLRKYNIIWYDNYNQMEKAFLNGDVSSVIVDEVNYNNIENTHDIDLHRIEDIQEDYAIKTGYSNYPFYGMFIKTTVIENDQENFVNFAKLIKSSINTYKSNKTTFNEVLENADIIKIGFNNKNLISESYNYCGLDFRHAIDEVDNIKAILSICEIELNDNILVR